MTLAKYDPALEGCNCDKCARVLRERLVKAMAALDLATAALIIIEQGPERDRLSMTQEAQIARRTLDELNGGKP